MRDYKEPISTVQKRHQLRRLFGVMGGMVFVFLIFIAGIKVGIQLERERMHIAQEATSRGTVSEGKGTTEGNGKETTTLPPEKQDKKMQFTFYETLTRKEGEKEQKKQEKATTPKEKEQVTAKKEEAKAPSRPFTKAEETRTTSGNEERYFVQIASFKKKEGAEGLKDKLEKKGYRVRVIPVEIAGMGLWYRVRLGGYTSLKEARSAQKRISAEEGFTGTTVVSER